MTPALALRADVIGGTKLDPPIDDPDDEQTVFAERVEALRRLHPAKARLLALIAETMLREAREIEAKATA